jgi:lysophospholipase L1-like esterase
MLLRRAAAALAAAALTVLAGCDDGSTPDRTSDGTAAGTAAGPATTGTTTGTDSSSAPAPTYVALGDSYTAAPGVPQTEATTGCFRSDGNYPHLVADRLGSPVVDVSCSGATTDDLGTGQQTGGLAQPPQLAALSADTTLVTLGIGGNDFGLFSTLIGDCAQVAAQDRGGSPCRDRMQAGGEQQDVMVDDVARIGARVTSSLQAIRRRAPNADVVLVGYPQPVPAQGSCRILPLATGDYPYVRSVVADLNRALSAAAGSAGARFVDVAAASAGHDVCAGAEAWVNGSRTDLTRAIAYHPFAVEQQAVADLVVARLAAS